MTRGFLKGEPRVCFSLYVFGKCVYALNNALFGEAYILSYCFSFHDSLEVSLCLLFSVYVPVHQTGERHCYAQ